MRRPRLRLLPATPLGPTAGSDRFCKRRFSLFLVEVEEIAGIDFQGARELEDVVETDILFSALHFADEITVDLYHLA